MQKSLLDTLRQQINTRPQVEARDTSVAANSLLNVKNTGRAGTTNRGPQVTSSAEVAANQQTQNTLNQQAQNNQIAASQIGIQQEQQQTQQQQQELSLAQNARQVTEGLAQTESEILGELERDRESINTEQGRLNLEILGASLALQDQEYLYALENQGRNRRLDDDIAFKTELQKAAFENNITLFRDEIEFQQVLSADQREFDEYVAQFNIEDAIENARNAAQANAIRGATEAVGNIAGALIDKDKKTTTTTTPASTTKGV